VAAQREADEEFAGDPASWHADGGPC